MTNAVSRDQGFLTVPDVLQPAEVTTLRAEVAMMRGGRAGVRHALTNPVVRRIAEDPRLVRLASDLLGAPAQPFKGTLFDKSATTNWLVAWHQDLALPVRERVEAPGWGPWSTKGGRLYALAPAGVLAGVVALRVHVDDSTSDNGPLRVLPNTHLLGRLSEVRIAELARERPRGRLRRPSWGRGRPPAVDSARLLEGGERHAEAGASFRVRGARRAWRRHRVGRRLAGCPDRLTITACFEEILQCAR